MTPTTPLSSPCLVARCSPWPLALLSCFTSTKLEEPGGLEEWKSARVHLNYLFLMKPSWSAIGSMFYLSRIEHKLPFPPSRLVLPIREAIHMELEKLFLDKLIANLGLCISISDIRSINGGFIFLGDGAPTYTVVFNLIMFHPFVEEIITTRLLSFDVDGLRYGRFIINS
ncbi:DNA-directed RNA polymerase III subunit rpc8 [Spatholobus suberectus]|nr:DNA-directed RNA polymerase III subunit rpc8 [Spatholobus suberectus]